MFTWFELRRCKYICKKCGFLTRFYTKKIKTDNGEIKRICRLCGLEVRNSK